MPMIDIEREALRKFYQEHLTMDRAELGAHLLSIHMNMQPGSCGAPSGDEYWEWMQEDPKHWAWSSIDALIVKARSIPCPHCGQLYDPEKRR